TGRGSRHGCRVDGRKARLGAAAAPASNQAPVAEGAMPRRILGDSWRAVCRTCLQSERTPLNSDRLPATSSTTESCRKQATRGLYCNRDKARGCKSRSGHFRQIHNIMMGRLADRGVQLKLERWHNARALALENVQQHAPAARLDGQS